MVARPVDERGSDAEVESGLEVAAAAADVVVGSSGDKITCPMTAQVEGTEKVRG